MKLTNRLIAIGLVALFFVLSYFLVAFLVTKRGVFYEPLFPGEERIPFLPWTFWVYILVYIGPPVAFLLVREKRESITMVKAFGVGLAVHVVFWILYPVKFGLRPELPADPGLFMKFVSFYYNLDAPPVNCFPSLHVSYAFLGAYALHLSRPRVGSYFFVLAVLISLSTMTFKQHYLADVLSGFVLAVILKWIYLDPLEKKGLPP